MPASHLRPALLSLLLLFGPGCARPVTPPGGPDAGTSNTPCVTDSDCPDPHYFVCSPSSFTCQPSCRQAADCDAAHRGLFALPGCDGPLGCQCDQGACVKAQCAGDGQCPANTVCRAGDCAPLPTADQVARCAVVPDVTVLRSGTAHDFDVLAWDGAGQAVVPLPGQVEWSSDGGVLLLASSGRSNRVLGAGADGDAELVARVGAAECSARVAVLGTAVAAGMIRAVVTDALSGRPLGGVQVLLSADAPGAAPLASGKTDGTGTALLPADSGTGSLLLTAFSPEHDVLTLAGVDAQGLRDFRLPLRRRADGRHGGFAGPFAEVPATPLVHLGIAGLSPGDPLGEVTPGQLFGPAHPRALALGTAVQQSALPLPDGVFVGVDQTFSRGLLTAEGDPGVCADAPGHGDDVESAIAGGGCGTRAGWALSEDVPLGDLPLDVLAADPEQLSYSALLARGAPLARRLNSVVQRDVEFGVVRAPAMPDGGTLFPQTPFVPSFAVPPAVPAGLAVVADVPTLPLFAGRPLDGVVLMGEVVVPGRGQIPLGLSGAVSSTGRALPDLQPGMARQGLVPLRMAPAHHGLEGSPYVLQAQAVQLRRDSAAGWVASVLVSRPGAELLGFDPDGSDPLALGGPFPALPQGASYDPGADGGTRQLTLSLDPSAAAATAATVRFSSPSGAGWTVVADPGRMPFTLWLPVPPAGAADPTLAAPGVPADLTARVLWLDARPQTGDAPIDFRMVAEDTGTNLEHAGDLVRAYAVAEFPHPQLHFTSPAPGSTLQVGSVLTAQVTGFRLGQGNAVSFALCGKVVTTDSDPSLGRGVLSLAVPSGCAGTTEVVATLLHGGAPLGPPVRDTLTVQVR